MRETGGGLKRNFSFIVLDLGQAIDVGEHFRLRVFGGLDYLYLKQNLVAAFVGSENAYKTTSDSESRFSGTGPRVGLSGIYLLTPNIALTGLFAGSVSVGKMSPQMTFVSSADSLRALGITENRQAITAQKTTQVVPGVEARIGFAYQVQSAYLSECVIEAGFATAAFLDATAEQQPSTAVVSVQSGTTAVDTMSRGKSNFGVNGPYLGARIRPKY